MEFGILIAATIPFDDPLLIAIVAIRTTGVRIVGLEQLILLGTRVGVFLLLSDRKVLVLGGMGGIGKTQIAIRYALKHPASTTHLRKRFLLGEALSLDISVMRTKKPRGRRSHEDETAARTQSPQGLSARSAYSEWKIISP